MAISYVGSAVGSDATTATSYTVDVSGLSLAENDVLVAAYGWTSGSNDSVGLPSGDSSGAWQSCFTDLYANDSADTNHRMAYQVVGATPDATITVPALNSTAYASCCVILAFRGVDTTTPLDGVTPTTATGTNTSQADAPAITPTTAGAWIVAGYQGVTDATPSDKTSPANMTAGTIKKDAGSTWGCIVGLYYYSGWSSGAFDPDAWTGGESAATHSCAAGTIVLRPRGGIDLTGPTVTATPGTVALSTAVAPSGPTVTVTPGTAAMGLDVDLIGPTVAVTPGTTEVEALAGLTPVGPTVAVTPGTLTLEVDIAPVGPTVSATAGSLGFSVGVDPIGPTVAVSPGAPVVGLSLDLAGPTVSATPGALAFADVQDITPSGPTVSVADGTPAFALSVAPVGPTVSVGAGTLSIFAPDVFLLDPGVAVGAGEPAVSQGIAPEGAAVSVQPGMPLVADADELDEGGLPKWRRFNQQ